MEIREWIRSLGDRARLLVIIPLAAGSFAALVTLVGPASFQASATVILPQDSSGASLTGSAAQRVADFTGAVRSDGVLDAVSQQTEVPRGDLGSVSVTRSGSSSVLVVGFTGSNGDDTGRVAETAARAALTAIAQARVDAAQAELGAAQDQVDAADQAFQDAQDEIGIPYSGASLESLAGRALRLRDEQNEAAARNDIAEVNRLANRIESQQAVIDDLRALESLFQARGSAQQVLFGAQAVLAEAQGALSSAETLSIPVSRPQPVSKLQEAARRFVFVAAIGFLLALGLVLLLQLMDRRRTAVDEVGPRRRPAA